MLPANFSPLNDTQWRKVQSYVPLPILSATRRAFKSILNNQHVNFAALAQQAEQDPALCWHLHRAISQQAHDKQEVICSAKQCLSLLGMQPIVELVKNLPVLNPQEAYAQNYLKQLQSTLFNARLAYKLALQSQPAKAQQIYWHALLAYAPLWRLSMQYPEFMQAFMRLLEGNIKPMQANLQVFGKDSAQQWLELAKCMRLPHAVTALYDQTSWSDIDFWQTLRKQDPRHATQHNKPMLQRLQDSALILQSTCYLSLVQLSTPQYANSFRWVALNAHILGQSPQQVLQQVRDTQLHFAHQGLPLSALGLDKLAAPAYPVPRFSVASKDSTSLPVEQTLSASSIDYLVTLIAQLQQPKVHFKNWLSLMQVILDGIEKGIELPIGAVLLKNPTGVFVSTHYSLDTPANDGIKSLKIHYKQEGILQKLMLKPSIIQITPHNHAYLKAYGESVQTRIPKQSCLMSIHSGAAPIGMVLCASANAKQAISEKQQQAFKALCLKASAGLCALKQTTRPSA